MPRGMAAHDGDPEAGPPARGLYYVDEGGALRRLAAGSYSYDDALGLRPAADLRSVAERLPWEKLPEVVEAWTTRGAAERRASLVGAYALAALVLLLAAYLAHRGVIEGHGIVGFLGAALGYVLASGREGARGAR